MSSDTNDDRVPVERLQARLVAAALAVAAVLQASAGPVATLACLAVVEALAPVPAVSLAPDGVALAPDGGVPVTRLLAGAVVLRLVGRLWALATPS